MRKEKSCGTIVFKDGKVLLVKHIAGHWSFPKGHVENNETEKETALRETKEETNLDVNIVSDERFSITYSPKRGVMKDVIFFIAEPITNNLVKQDSEIQDIGYFTIDEAFTKLTHSDEKNLLERVLNAFVVN